MRARPGRVPTAKRGIGLGQVLLVGFALLVFALAVFPLLCESTPPRRGQCTSNLHHLLQAVQMYREDWGVYPTALYGLSYDGANLRRQLYPEYVNREDTFVCPDSPVKLRARRWIRPVDASTGEPSVYAVPEFSSYDFQYRPATKAGVPELHYVRRRGGVQASSSHRQLIYPDAPDNTVVTWCLYHSDMDKTGKPAAERHALVAFLDGRVQLRPAEQLVPGATISPPWLIAPKD